jgi:long-subunit fatty acid transport protein
MKKISLFILIIAVMVGNLFAFTYLGSVEGIGDTVLSVTGRALGMGNTSIASCSGVNSIFYNPANMIKNKKPALSLGFGMFPIKETVEADSSYYSSAKYYKFTGAAAMCPVLNRFMVGAGYRPVMDLSYKHELKIYSAGELNNIIDYDQRGSLNKGIISLAAGILPSINIGFNYNLLGNKYEAEAQYIVVETTKLTINDSSKFKGEGYGLGINCELISDVLDIGVKWIPECKVNKEWDVKVETRTWVGNAWSDSPAAAVDSKGKLEYDSPMEIGFGVSYSFWERERSVLAVDIVRTLWEDFRYTEVKDTANANYKVKQNPGYRNTTRISVGVEHYLNLNTVLRYGFTHLPHYSRTSADTTMFTVGVGFSVNRNVRFDMAGAYGKRNFYDQIVFFDDDQKVDERIAGLIVSTEWRF